MMFVFSSCLAITACAIGLVALILVTQWATNPTNPNDQSYIGVPTTLLGYPGSENVFAWHPILMVGGFFFGQVLAINTWSILPNLTAAKILHVLWLTTAACCMIAGLTAVVKDQFVNKAPSLTSMHSWIGICGVAMFCMNYLSGSFMAMLTSCLPDSKIRTSIDWLTIHRFLGLSALGISSSAIYLGVMDQFGMYKCVFVIAYDEFFM